MQLMLKASSYFAASITDLKKPIPPSIAENPVPWLVLFFIAAVSLMIFAIKLVDTNDS